MSDIHHRRAQAATRQREAIGRRQFVYGFFNHPISYLLDGPVRSG